MTIEKKTWTLDELILANKVKLGRGNIISKKDIEKFPGEFPIYSSAREKNGTFGYYGKYMFDEELITWSIDGGGRLFYRPRHKFSVTNVGGTLRILDKDFLDCRYLHLVLTHLHSKIRFDWVYKAHPSVIRLVYKEIPIPSLEIQHAIVEKLDSAFADIDLLEGNLELSDEKASQLLESILSSTFTPVDEGYSAANQDLDMKFVPLGEVCTLEYGKPLDKEFRKPDGAFQAYGANGPISRSSKYLIEGPCVIVGRKGSAGEITYIKENVWPLDVTYYVRHDPKESDLRYLFYTLQNLDIKQFVRGVKPGLNRNDVYNLPIPLPSPEKQREIVKKLDSAFAEIELLKKQIRTKKEYATTLRQSLLNGAFTQEEAVA